MSRETMRSLLDRADQGQLMADADEKLTELIDAIAANGGKGTITIKVEVKEVKGKDAVSVTPSLEMKKPQPARLTTPYFRTPDGGLTRRHGAQPDLPGTADRTGLDDDETVDEDGVVTKLRKR